MEWVEWGGGMGWMYGVWDVVTMVILLVVDKHSQYLFASLCERPK